MGQQSFPTARRTRSFTGCCCKRKRLSRSSLSGSRRRHVDMAKFTNRLDSVRIASPCPADWDSMYGNERVRFCGQCQLHVYNLSDMSKAEAEQLIGQTEGRLCVRYYKRRDGSIITQNCPLL